MAKRPVASDLFVGEGDGAVLLGGRRRSDGEVVFPYPTSGEAFERIELPTQGTLWAFTVQRFRPKEPYNGAPEDKPFVPYVVGYVELPVGGLVVETRIAVDDVAHLTLNQPMRVTTEVLRVEPNGDEILTYAFRPTEPSGERP